MARHYGPSAGYPKAQSRGGERRNVDRYRDADSRRYAQSERSGDVEDEWRDRREMQSPYPDAYSQEWPGEDWDENAWRRSSPARERDIYEQQRSRRNDGAWSDSRFDQRGGAGRWRFPEEVSAYSNPMFGADRRRHQGSNNYGASKYGGSEYEQTDFDRYSSERSNYGGPYSTPPSAQRPAEQRWRRSNGGSDWYPEPSAIMGDRERAFTGRGPKGYVRSDERLKEIICERLTEAPHIDASEIALRVKSGEVTLTGSVPDRRTKFAAEELVEACSGVTEIHNELRVGRGSNSGSSSSNTPDERKG